MKPLFVRLDVEDWLTPASTWALDGILRLLAERGLAAHFALVGKKARQLAGSGRGDLLARMAAQGVMGSHSWSHSEHPTLAEELEPLPAETARMRLIEREQPTVDLLTRLGVAPRFFTQPGGNWLPDVSGPAGRALGFEAVLSESWNSYLKPTPGPMWYGGLLYWAPAVDLPKGLFFRLPEPDAVQEGAQAIRAAWRAGRTAVLVAHPTELVTTAFWDQRNFWGGTAHGPARPGPARPAAAWQPALDGLARMLDALGDPSGGPESVTVDRWLGTAVAPTPTRVDRWELRDVLRRVGVGPARLAQGSLSAAEIAWALAHFEAGGGDVAVVPPVGAPGGRWPGPGADGILAAHAAWGHLPAFVGNLTLEDWVAGAGARLAGTAPRSTWREAVRGPAAVHWDWPIFPPGFTAPRLLTEAARLAWTLKPLVERSQVGRTTTGG
jgi:peptidoglycan/xylan/chitin deacetylase (PgdA/CDA1 family)